MNQENCEKVIEILQCTHTTKSFKLTNNELGKLFDSAQSGNEMAFIYLAEWFFTYAQTKETSSPFETALYETLRPFFKN
ncbi:hypothetical protein [Fusibacter ferrireducens]|uniref:Uncharacterized protein n=1 Tax=Fusibacter ferrireducens TaxID=2785058 RepID=A0ABR9ZXV4_9FIRM|nr:hypothetical protein [Fusibacter ferrireducens]MBF4695290.1 hypothetical protein [Fusibacter ferrireducens]